MGSTLCGLGPVRPSNGSFETRSSLVIKPANLGGDTAGFENPIINNRNTMVIMKITWND